MLEITACSLVKRVVYHWDWKPLKTVLYRPDRLVFLFIIVIYWRKGKKHCRRQVAALAGPACGSCCVWILLQTSAPRLWCGSGACVWREHGWNIPTVCKCQPWLAGWPGRCGWLAAAGAELRCHSQALAILAKAFFSVLCAKHKWNKPSTIMQVKKRREEEVELLCGWSLYHINNWEIMNLHYWIIFFTDLLFQVKLIHKQTSNTTCQIIIICMLNSWLWLFL